ncbi:hypothetical protein SAMN05421868_1523 [Paenibacillus naphthalenovorans]|nr:hypothetical protein SAMN05421868_1523 [Paenibacillus naphthalenovorans]
MYVLSDGFFFERVYRSEVLNKINALRIEMRVCTSVYAF